jgi:gamma-D-glutamyl-L-lysine dipeptidyl-peptidase
MDNVVATVAVAPLRKAASHTSEMCSQLLFGELAFLLEKQNGFYLIRCLFDGYEGWCAANQLQLVDHVTESICTTSILTEIQFKDQMIRIPLGSILSTLNLDVLMPKDSSVQIKPILFNPANIRNRAMMFLNTPYLWGGKSVFGIDCSGFVQQLMKQFGIVLSRDANQQIKQGDSVGFLQEAICGDLAFFDDADGNIIHVGVLLNSSTIIHAAGMVRIDSIDHMGIINKESGERTHQLRVIKRLA